MKLLFYISSLNGGGAERVMVTLMNNFVKQGDMVRCICTESLKPSVYHLDSRIELIYMMKNGPDISKSFFNKVYRHIWKFPAIRREAKKFKPDIVISFIRTQNNDVLASLLGTGYPVVIGDHTNIDRKYRLLTTILSAILYPRASAITMLTRKDYNIWKLQYKNVFYMPNPCEDSVIPLDKEREKVVLAVGRVRQWNIKGFDNFMLAWNNIKDRFPDWRCCIAGRYDEESLNSLRQTVGEDVFNSVQLLGFRNDIYNLLASSEVFCLTSRYEGMPMALLEALNHGCACVAFDCNTGPADMINDEENGLLVEDQNINDLQLKLERMLSDDSLRKKIQKKAPLSVKKFSVDNILLQWNEMFKTILSK